MSDDTKLSSKVGQIIEKIRDRT